MPPTVTTANGATREKYAAECDPLSPAARNINGHVNYLDPPFGLSLPTNQVPDPFTRLFHLSESSLRRSVQERDNNICHYCGLRSPKYQEIVGPLSTVTASQARLACHFCAQVMALNVASTEKSGVLIHLPEFGQAELNAYARILYVCRISQGPAADLARRALTLIMTRRAQARERLGTDDPWILAAMLTGCTKQADIDALTFRLRGIRLFPLDRRLISEGDLRFNQFPQILAYWRSKDGPFGSLAPAKMDLRQFESKLDPFETAT